MITKEQVRKGFAKGILNLAANPEMETGTVCTIGDQWFCISDTADRLSPEEYLRTVPMPIVHEEVYEALDGMDKEEGFDDLYSYCAAVLSLMKNRAEIMTPPSSRDANIRSQWNAPSGSTSRFVRLMMNQRKEWPRRSTTMPWTIPLGSLVAA